MAGGRNDSASHADAVEEEDRALAWARPSAHSDEP